MMGGSGTRFGAKIPKQFTDVAGKPLFSYIVEKYATLSCIHSIIIVCNNQWVDYTKEYTSSLHLGKPVRVVAGGSSRSESVRNGLACASEYANQDDVVLIHDATHPYVDEEGVARVIQATHECGGATLGACQYDTVYQINPQTQTIEDVIPRQTIVSGASPEAFRFGRIWEIYRNATIPELESYTSAGALARAYDIVMKVIPTDYINLKITYRQDMDAFMHLFHDYYF